MEKQLKNGFKSLSEVLSGTPSAAAVIRGDREHGELRGVLLFFDTPHGVLVAAEVTGLPTRSGNCDGRVFGFHIHAGGSCTGTEALPFSNADGHYNPENCAHPFHAGDMPPLFGNNGYAVSVFLTGRFKINEIIGKTVIIHADPDDFKSQPSGNAGAMIACGEIVSLE